MKKIEMLLAIFHYVFYGLGDLCWSGKEVLRELREGKEPADEEPEKSKRKKKS